MHGDLALLTGDDIIPDRTLLARHLQAHARRPAPNVAIVRRIEWAANQPITHFMGHLTGAGGQQFNFAALAKASRAERESLPTGWFVTANVSLKRAWLVQTGELFDERIPYAAYEDLEFALRLQVNHGLRIAYEPRTLGRHLHPQTYASFSQRQIKAGRSAAILTRVRPETRAYFVKGDLHEQLRARSRPARARAADPPVRSPAHAGRKPARD
ncbi:MAG: hypothetical protein FJ029_02540 [Actinobacteria bacterium]|nr:hypothetical protein [Actinomycetota bacterium]